MRHIGELAQQQRDQRPRGRTFEAGLTWLCEYVSRKATTMYTTMDVDEDEDLDVTQHK